MTLFLVGFGLLAGALTLGGFSNTALSDPNLGEWLPTEQVAIIPGDAYLASYEPEAPHPGGQAPYNLYRDQLARFKPLPFAAVADAPVQLADTHARPEAKSLSPQRTRGYLALRYGRAFYADQDIVNGFRIAGDSGQELFAVGVGFNWGRYFGLEASGEFYESDLNDLSTGNKTGEYTVVTFLPQIRLRYPLMDDRLTPYVVGGAGVALTEFNDRTPAGSEPGVNVFKGVEISFIYSVGGGLEYFIADNLALNFEAKYVFHDADATVNGVSTTADLDSLLLSGGLRLFFPGPQKAAPTRPPSAADWWNFDGSQLRPYLGLRLGVPYILDNQITPGFDLPTEERQQLMSGSLGFDLNRHWGVEFFVNHYETDVNATGMGKVAEFAIWNFGSQLRVRYPIMEDRWVPYLIGGVGAGSVEVNDRTVLGVSGMVPRFSADSFAPIFTLGAGIEYFIADNFALGLESKYLYHRNDVEVGGVKQEVNIDAILTSLGLRIYF